jgi:signal transduction histidine kinase
MLWSELAPLRLAGGQADVRVQLIEVAARNRTFAVYALTESAATPPTLHWMPLARAVVTGVAAGIVARGLADEVRAEAQARDAYISLAAHELRSPLTAIKGYAQLLARQARKNTLPATMLHSVASIEQQTMRLSEMLGELLDASRVRRGRLALVRGPVDVVPTAQRVLERRRILFPQHTFVLNAPDEPEGPLIAVGEVARVEQILRDLLDNAAHHSPGRGTISVRIARQGADALLAVSDSGIGVAPADRDHIFEYLYRAPRSDARNLSGLGLGLYVSAHLAERMGGRLWLEHSSDEAPTGSEFRFTLPLA